MALKVVVRLGTLPPSPSFSLGADRCSLALHGDVEEHLHFDRVYSSDVPTSKVFNDGLLPLVKLALTGRCSSVIVLGQAGGRGGTAGSEGATRKKNEQVAEDPFFAKESELGLSLALVWLTLQALLVGLTPESGEAPPQPPPLEGLAILISWCRFSSDGGEPADVLRELLRAGRVADSQGSPSAATPPPPRVQEDLYSSVRDMADRDRSLSDSTTCPVNVFGLTEVVLSSMEGVLETLSRAQACIGHQEHSLLNIAVERGVSEARGLLRFFSLAAGNMGIAALQRASDQSGCFPSDTAGVGLPGQPPAVHPQVDQLLRSCLHAPHRTLLVATAGSYDAEVLPALRLAASLQAAAPSTILHGCSAGSTAGMSTASNDPPVRALGEQANLSSTGSPSHFDGATSVSTATLCAAPRSCQRAGGQHQNSRRTRRYASAPRRFSQAGAQAISSRAGVAKASQRAVSTGGRCETTAFMVARGHRRGYSRANSLSGNRCVDSANSTEAGLRAQICHSEEREAAVGRLAEARGRAVAEMQAKAAALESRCAMLSEEVQARNSEMSEDVGLALRAKDRAILELQVRAGEARRREAQLLVDLETAARELALFHRAAAQEVNTRDAQTQKSGPLETGICQETACQAAACKVVAGGEVEMGKVQADELQVSQATREAKARQVASCEATPPEITTCEPKAFEVAVCEANSRKLRELRTRHNLAETMKPVAGEVLYQQVQEVVIGSSTCMPPISDHMLNTQRRAVHEGKAKIGKGCNQWQMPGSVAAQDSDSEAAAAAAGFDSEVSGSHSRIHRHHHRVTNEHQCLSPTILSDLSCNHQSSPDLLCSTVESMWKCGSSVPSKLSVSLQSTASSLAPPTPCMRPHEASASLARLWELAELRGFLDARFGDLRQAMHGLAEDRSVVNLDEFLNSLEKIGFSDDRELLLRLFSSLDMDKDGLVSIADLLRLPE